MIAAFLNDENTDPPPMPWFLVQSAVLSVCAKKAPDFTSVEREDVLGEVLAEQKLSNKARSWEHVAPGDWAYCADAYLNDFVSYPSKIAANIIVDSIKERQQRRLDALSPFADYGPATRKLIRFEGRGAKHVSIVDREEMKHVRRIHKATLLKKGPVPLTAFELEDFWQTVADHCARRYRQRFGTSWTRPAKRPTRQEIAAMPIAPEVGTWISLMSGPLPNTPIFTTTTTEEIYARENEAIKKAFQRNRNNRHSCPPSSTQNRDSICIARRISQ